MAKLILKKEDYQKILEYSRQHKPVEACGIIAGIIDQEAGKYFATKVYLMENTKNSSEHYLMEPEEQFDVFKDMRENELDLISVFHSHPHSPARPSQEDIEMANYKEAIYLIISLQQEKEDFRAYFIQDEQPEEIEIEVEI
jgi:proteasome lid subunit RPN8/RPN11